MLTENCWTWNSAATNFVVFQLKENKNEGNENKIILGDFNCNIDKMQRDGENKTNFIDVILIIPYQNSSWIMDSRIYGEGRTQNPLSLPDTIDLLIEDPG